MPTEKFKPVPVRLRELKAPLQQLAFEEKRSMNWLIVDILKDYLKKKKLFPVKPVK